MSRPTPTSEYQKNKQSAAYTCGCLSRGKYEENKCRNFENRQVKLLEPERRGTTTGEEELDRGQSIWTRGAPEQRGEEEKESRRGEIGIKEP